MKERHESARSFSSVNHPRPSISYPRSLHGDIPTVIFRPAYVPYHLYASLDDNNYNLLENLDKLLDYFVCS